MYFLPILMYIPGLNCIWGRKYLNPLIFVKAAFWVNSWP